MHVCARTARYVAWLPSDCGELAAWRRNTTNATPKPTNVGVDEPGSVKPRRNFLAEQAPHEWHVDKQRYSERRPPVETT